MLFAPLVCRPPACLHEYVSIVCEFLWGRLKRGILLITTTGACILNVEDWKFANMCSGVVTTPAEPKFQSSRFDMHVQFLSAFWCDDIVTSTLGKSTSGDLPIEELAPNRVGLIPRGSERPLKGP